MQPSISTPVALPVPAIDAPPFIDTSLKETSMRQAENPEDNGDQQQHHESQDDVVSIAAMILQDQEPFETFQHKVVELAAKQFPRSPKDIAIYQMKGGSYNRVVGVIISSKPKKSGLHWFLRRCLGARGKKATPKLEPYIVRIPRTRYEDEDPAATMARHMERKVAILKTVGSRLPSPVPKVFSYDLTTTNVFERPYMIQTRLPGRNLWLELWSQLNEQQKKYVAKHITDLAPVIASVEGLAGNISSGNLSRPSTSSIYVDAFYTQAYDDQQTCKPTLTRKPIDHLLERCEQWRACERSTGFCFEEIWDGFGAISKALEIRDFLYGSCVLVHGDLKPYNLLAEVRNETEVDITGVIDWDSAIIAPEFMAYRAPFWLWTPEDMDSEKADEETMASFEPISEEGQGLKQVFLENASEKYKLYAFAPEAMLARRMFHILQESLRSAWEFEEAKNVIRKWNELHPEDGVQYPDSDTDSISDAHQDDSK
ncbi:uncharacterized protein ALTATR162_LOCUS7100 [Alternaria atra]|uniref:Aminoglycoside phosphotransferase domain-containing protein n=1 Tax=Alternaria atra TaxID=119953 RepID=A0A8J2I587_9PLEO|nr:uncharacterized protein ALTATR162_LOCUS7100 [Alternaria atra]CAG5169910.1 unnamed protein product [Alternaria atra]